jgi:hypothetical protein
MISRRLDCEWVLFYSSLDLLHGSADATGVDRSATANQMNQLACGPREGVRETNVDGETPESENISRKHHGPSHRHGDRREIAGVPGGS